ncbi:hypothetical protein HAX54_045456, partial [Datura stramonium]|nr:hypothetical protein [Datura stramonium]
HCSKAVRQWHGAAMQSPSVTRCLSHSLLGVAWRRRIRPLLWLFLAYRRRVWNGVACCSSPNSWRGTEPMKRRTAWQPYMFQPSTLGLALWLMCIPSFLVIFMLLLFHSSRASLFPMHFYSKPHP